MPHFSLVRPLKVSLSSLSLLTSSAALLGQATSPGAPAPAVREDEVVALSPFSVNADRDVGFVAASALAGGRLATDLKDTPIAYSVLTREFIDALSLTDVTKASAWAPNASFAKDDGRSTSFGRVGFNDLINFRGVPSNRAQINFFPVHFDYDSYNLERFDFARGPNSILFGTGSMGGSANGLYKEARTDRTIRDLTLSVGSWDAYRLSLDINQPVNSKFAVRANGLWQDENTWREREFVKREAGSLHLVVRPWEKTKILVVGEKGKVRTNFGTTTVGDRLSTWDGVTTYSAPVLSTPAASTGTQIVGNATAPSYIYLPGGGPLANSVVNWSLTAMTANTHLAGSLYDGAQAVGSNPGIVSEPLHNRINVPAGLLNRAGQAGFILPGREFSPTFDDTGYLNDYENLVVTLDQQVGDHLFLQGSANTSSGLRGTNYSTARGLKDGIQIDINRNLPTGQANPHFLEPYLQTTNDFDQVDTTSDQFRGSAAFVFEKTRFGDFRFNLEVGHEKLVNSREKYRYAVKDPAVDARTWASSTLVSWRYYYETVKERPIGNIGTLNVVNPLTGTTRSLPTGNVIDSARPTETIHTVQKFDYGQASLNAKFFDGRLNLIGAARKDEYSTDSKVFEYRMDLPSGWDGNSLIYRPKAPANYNNLVYTPKAANGAATGPSQRAETRPRDGSGNPLAQYANDIFQDDFSPPIVEGDSTTYSYGGVFHLVPWISAFANYAETWSPPGVNLTIDGGAFGAVVSDGWDAGLRFSLLGGRLNLSALRYEGTQSNLTVSTGGTGQSINNIIGANVLGDLSLTGKNARGLQDVPRTYSDTVARKTEGYEFEAVANLARGWRLLANVAFAEATQGDALAGTLVWLKDKDSTLRQILNDAGVSVSSSNVATVNAGVTPATSPDASTAATAWNDIQTTLQNTTTGYQKVARLAEVTGNIFTDYTFQGGPLKNVRVGAGVNYRGREVIGFRGSDTIRNPTNPAAAIDDPNVSAYDAVYRPSYYTATLIAGYTTKVRNVPVRFNVVVDNLFDESDPLYYNTVMRPPGGDVTNPARVATPNLFSYLTPRSFKLSATVSF
ncbi:MAG TPA: TonB-dependent receptor plug domain-containing protein [Opitutaceae bacterium]|nr:TonB-dependent receptor plug domain-containing protein [Opitutaceae bacterium]